MAKHKYQVGDMVYDTYSDESAEVIQRRTENGHLCYLLSNGKTRHENQLKG